jgi:TusE/DsrC/DsvC family sulfur relay protein
VEVNLDELLSRLDAIDRKLDYVVARQRFLEELIDEMTPVGREAMTSMAAELARWEERGWFAMGREAVGLLDRLAAAYGPDDIHELSEHVVAIVDTIRNVTQPDVLQVANDATDALHNAEALEPVGVMKAMFATNDPDVRRGLAVALEVMRRIGRGRVPGAPGEAVAPTRPPPPAAGGSARPRPAAPRAAPPAPPSRATVEWEGVTFTGDGFLVDPERWSEELAVKMAAGLDLPLTEEHWAVIRWVRADFLASGASPNVRRVAAGSGAGAKRMYELFPRTPGRTVAMLAGVPKPVGCV